MNQSIFTDKFPPIIIADAPLKFQGTEYMARMDEIRNLARAAGARQLVELEIYYLSQLARAAEVRCNYLDSFTKNLPVRPIENLDAESVASAEDWNPHEGYLNAMAANYNYIRVTATDDYGCYTKGDILGQDADGEYVIFR